MSEPLLGVRVPEALGRQVDGYRATGPGGVSLAVVLQAFDDVKAQTSVAGICALYVKAGVRLLAVEAADRAIQPTPGRTDIARLIPVETVSAGVLSFLNSGTAAVDAWGVDDVAAIPPSHQAMQTVSAARPLRDTTFSRIRELLQKAQARHYRTELAQLRRARLAVYDARAPIEEQARLARAAARAMGLDLGGYPLVGRFLEMREKEKKINPKRVAAQQEEFVRRVIGGVRGWYKPVGKNEVKVDLEKAAPVLAFWLQETGQSLEEFGSFSRTNREAAFLACKEWFDAWLAGRAVAAGGHEFYELLMRLALRIEVPYFELRDFRESAAQMRDLEAMRVGLDDELGAVSDALVDSPQPAGPSPDADAGALRDVEERMDLIYRMLQLAVPPKDAEAQVARIRSLANTIEELDELATGPRAGSTSPPALPDLTPLEKALDAAKAFLRLSRQRSDRMVARTLELIRDRNEDRAVLVVGGFHSRAIARALEDHPEVSWAVIMPQVDVEAAWRQHRQRF